MSWVLAILAAADKIPDRWQRFTATGLLLGVVIGLTTQVVALDNKLNEQGNKRQLIENDVQSIKGDIRSINENLTAIQKLWAQKEENDRERYQGTTRQLDQLQRSLLRNRND